MPPYHRYAIYFLPPDGALADFGAAWLGYDTRSGANVAHPVLDGLAAGDIAAITERPRKYGFHATLKPPFHLAPGRSAQGLDQAARALAAQLAPVNLDGLALRRLGRFLALVPVGDTSALNTLAARIVADLDGFRRPPDGDELARRGLDRLSVAQRGLVERWGYPYVMEEFRMHMTLTGPMPPEQGARIESILAGVIPPTAPVRIDQIALTGARADGCFELIRRYPLTGVGQSGEFA